MDKYSIKRAAKAYHESLVQEYLDISFAEVNVTQTYLNSDFEPYRNINFKCMMGNLCNGSGLDPDDEFFRKLGKKIWDIIHEEKVVEKDLLEK